MKGRGSKKTYLMLALVLILIVSLVYLSRQDNVREGMKGKREGMKGKREPFRGREALNAGCYSASGVYLGTGTGIIQCQKNYPGQSATYKSY